MKRTPRLLLLVLVLIAVHVGVPVAFAHPLGNFTINHYAGLHITPEQITIDYILDMAEIPAFQEINLLDENQNQWPDNEEVGAYHPVQCQEIRSNLELRLNDRLAPLQLVSSALEFPPGQGGLLTLRLQCAFTAQLPGVRESTDIEFINNNFSDRLGWREIVVDVNGVIAQGNFASHSVSKLLTAYPQDLLSSPLDQRQVSFKVTSAPGAHDASDAKDIDPSPFFSDKNDAFSRLILLENITLPTLLLALVVSFLWGAMHAMTPGHGKTIVGAYLVGSRGTAKHALYLGLATTITHTTGVFVLGLVTLFAARFILPEKLFPWLSFVSGLLVVGIGANLFFNRMKASGILSRSGPVKDENPHDHHPHNHDPNHDHTHEHKHPYSHDPDHHHEHGHADKDDKIHTHDHHLPAGANGSPVTVRSLLALGISGGLLPCPSALVVLLSAIALNRVGFGLVLVFAFSLGLAGVLTGIGLLFVYAGRFFNRIPVQNRLLRLLPALSALFITLVGLGITVQALAQTGFIKL
jgi:ABC-type nickel/cobalt efflux system permease component RcnA